MHSRIIGMPRLRFSLSAGDSVTYRRVPDRFQVIYQEVLRQRMPEPNPALAKLVLTELGRMHREWVANDGLSELTRRRLRKLPPPVSGQPRTAGSRCSGWGWSSG